LFLVLEGEYDSAAAQYQGTAKTACSESAASHVTRGLNETADIHLKGRDDVLPVSRSYLHLFRQM